MSIYSYSDTTNIPVDTNAIQDGISKIDITNFKVPDVITQRSAGYNAAFQSKPLYTVDLENRPMNPVINPVMSIFDNHQQEYNPIITVNFDEVPPVVEDIFVNSHSEQLSKAPKDSPLDVVQKLPQINNIPIGNVPAFAPPKVICVPGSIKDRLGEQLKNKNRETRGAAVTELERRITQMQGRCPSDIVDDLRIRNFQLDASLMGEYLAQPGIYDHSFQDGMGCFIDAMVSNNPEDLIPDLRLRKWITNIRRIGGKSAEGMAFLLESGSYPLYVIKVTADPSDDTLAHEAVIGMGAINTLRDRIPNFVHTYGAFRCSPPILDASGNVVSWCPSRGNGELSGPSSYNKDSGITYLVLENIDNAQTLASLSHTLTREEFLQIYLQLLNALNVAYKAFDYTHYDLHASNVLIQTLSYTVSVPLYDPRGGLLYIKTNRLARIIDFGLSHIYLQGQHFGKFGFEFLNLDPESSFPMYDAYKVLLSSYWYSLSNMKNTSSNAITEIVGQIYSYFNEGKSLNQRLAERDNDTNNDYFQPSMNLKSVTFDSLMIYILDNFVSPSFVAKDQPSDAIATVCQDRCVNWDTFNKSVFDQSRLPNTLTDYCQAITAINKLTDAKYKQSLNTWLKQFDLDKAYTYERQVFLDNLNSNIDQLNSLQLTTVNDPNFNTSLYAENVYNLIRVRSAFLDNTLWVTSVICAFNSTASLSKVNNDITSLLKSTTSVRDRINNYLSIIQYNRDNASLYNIYFDVNTVAAHNILLT